MGRFSGPSSFHVVFARVLLAVSALARLMLAPGGAGAAEPLEVEVRGARSSAPPRDVSVAGSVITEERLRAPGLQAFDVLRTQPGVAVVDTGGYGALSTASIRGATAAQTPVYLAGVRVNDDVGGTADLSLVPLWFVRRVEVYRSNAPLAGDRLGIGGAIFFEPRLPSGTRAGAGVMSGSFGAKALWAHAGVGNADASALVALRSDTAKNDYKYLNDNGTRFDTAGDHVVRLTNADAHTLDAWAVASARLGGGAGPGTGRVNLVLNGIAREQGLPGFALLPRTRVRARFERKLAALSTSAGCGAGCALTTSASLISTHTAYEDPLGEAGFGAAELEFDATRVDTGASLSSELTPDVSLTPSVRGSIERLKLSGSNAATAHTERVSSRAALHAEWALSRTVTVRALGAAECDGTRVTGRPPTGVYGDSEGPTSGARACHELQTSARGPHLTVLANVGRYARVPTLTELYGISGAVRGNLALVPEVGVSAELGARATASVRGPLRGAYVDVFTFARDARNLVAFKRASTGYVVPYNVGSARVLGLEALAHYAPFELLWLELAATLLDPRSTAAGGPVNDILPYQSRLTVAPRVELRARWSGTISSARIASSCQMTSSRYADPAGLVVIPAQRAWEADAELGLWGDRLAVRARVANLLNETHFDLVGYPLPGRAAYVAMEAQW
jgi:vitamin B12 transporter